MKHSQVSSFAVVSWVCSLIILLAGGEVSALRAQEFKRRPAQLGPGPELIQGEFIVRYRAGVPFVDPARQLGLETVRRYPSLNATLVRQNQLMADANSDQKLRARLQAMPEVEYVVQNRVIRLTQKAVTPDDPMAWRQYALNAVRAPEAWAMTTGSKAVTVAVIDSGVDYRNPDLAENIWQNPGETGLDEQGQPKNTNGVDDDGNGYIDDWRGWNFQNNNNDPIDEGGHGTHCAGTIGARGGNGFGMAGLNWNVSIVPLRFLDTWGAGTLDAAVAAVEYAIKMKFDVSNNSWGGPGDDTEKRLWTDIFQKAQQQGHMLVIAAGNDGNSNDEETNNYPASIRLPNVLVVGASNDKDELVGYSNYGEDTVDLVAPGMGILSTVSETRFNDMSGTSMATPFVTGTVALIKSLRPDAGIEEIRRRILGSVDQIPSMRGLIISGGRLNIYRALLDQETTVSPAL